MQVAAGFFVDWDGNAHSTLDPGGGYLCDTDPVSRYVAVTTRSGTVMHEATFYKNLVDIEKPESKRRLCQAATLGASPAKGFETLE